MTQKTNKTKILTVEPYYVITCSEDGNVKINSFSKHKGGKELAQNKNKGGYVVVKMNNKSRILHQVVAECVLGKRPVGMTVNHKDGNKLNNNPKNLEYISFSKTRATCFL